MQVIFVGRSNVGKSSVLRMITGKKIPVGKKPGVTRRINKYFLNDLVFVDFPGFGFMYGVPGRVQERVKRDLIRYIEENREEILFGVQIIDGKSFMEIVERWERRGQIPIDIEFFELLEELDLNPLLVVNKIDKIRKEKLDEVLNQICEKLGLLPPWRQWLDRFIPVSAKTGENILLLKKVIRRRIGEVGKGV
ncbi:MAG: GTP-binding protein EngB [Candidatus Hydrothermarchaeota archaeon]